MAHICNLVLHVGHTRVDNIIILRTQIEWPEDLDNLGTGEY